MGQEGEVHSSLPTFLKVVTYCTLGKVGRVYYYYYCTLYIRYTVVRLNCILGVPGVNVSIDRAFLHSSSPLSTTRKIKRKRKMEKKRRAKKKKTCKKILPRLHTTTVQSSIQLPYNHPQILTVLPRYLTPTLALKVLPSSSYTSFSFIFQPYTQ